MEVILTVMLVALAASNLWLYVILRRRRVEERELAEYYVKERKDFRKDLDTERRDLLDCLVDEVLFFNAQGNLLFYNAAVTSLFQGRKLDGVMVQELFYEGSVTKAVEDCLLTSAGYFEEMPMGELSNPMGVTSSRRESICRVEVSPAKLLDNDRCVCVIIRDVTADVEAEQVRRDFVANASHELRTPMSIIGGYLENLLEDGGLDDPDMTRKFASVMQKHSLRISKIVEDMLSISMMESTDQNAMNYETFSVLELVDDVSERLSTLISQGGVEFIVSIEPRDLTLTGDKFYWTQILFNLIENAIKQNPLKNDLRVVVSSWLENNSFYLSVLDNGKGIPAADVPFVFKRFYRVEKHHANSLIKGTGLGLSIVRRAVEAHGGEVSLKSTPGVETVFSIRLTAESGSK